MSPRKVKASFLTIVPSPYQRDLFGALAAREDIELQVFYMEAASPDSPWPEKGLRSFEKLLPGFWVPFGGARWHFNWNLPDFSVSDFVVLSSITSWTGQRLMRHALRRHKWLFWGERLRRQPAGWRDWSQRKLTSPLARATGIVGIGCEAENDYIARFPGVRHFCIPYHCDLSAFLAIPRRERAANPPTFLFCGQMIRRKGVDLLLTAFSRILAQGHTARLMLVGREGELREFLNPLPSTVRACVQYEGFQPPERLPDCFARADIFVMPSRHDGWGVVVNQALGAGLPVITSDAVGAGLDLVEENVNGLCFPAGDVEKLERCMVRLTSSPELARSYGEASRRKALAITPEAGAEKWERVFQTLSLNSG